MEKEITLREHLANAGRVRSLKKTRAGQENGKLGGRPITWKIVYPESAVKLYGPACELATYLTPEEIKDSPAIYKAGEYFVCPELNLSQKIDPEISIFCNKEKFRRIVAATAKLRRLIKSTDANPHYEITSF